MDTEEIKQAAFDWDRPVDQSLPMPERLLWHRVKEIYKMYAEARITKAEGASMVNEAERQYRIDSTLVAMQRLQITRQAQMWKDIERLGSQYRLDRTVSNADAFVDAVYGLNPNP